ncbi:MAG: zinc-dependent alcohol dehydrogenase family protein [Acidobacteria bacterium]|nr:zinc-dependent alcohol dehydrogenase family protein [Acidobacteriota bacterium]
MKGMRLREIGPLAAGRLLLEEFAAPEPGPGEARIRVSVCATCRTDLHIIEGDLPAATMPIVPGHQAVGVVDLLGRSCSRLRVGERVGIAWLRGTCGSCAECLRGDENLCPAARFTGYHADGGYAGWALVPEAFAYRIPEVFTDEQAAPLLCAGIIGYRALRRSEVPPGGRLGIFGFGSSAHVTIQIARHRGCEVFVFTREEAHRRLARRLGAAWVGETFDPAPAALDGAILFAPAGEIVPHALRSLRAGGTLALAGIHVSTIPAMEYGPHIFREKRLTSVTANTRADGEELLREAAGIPIRPQTRLYPLEKAVEALTDARDGRVEGTAVLSISGR